MTDWQLLLRLQGILRSRRWLDTGQIVFARQSVIVTTGFDPDLLARLKFPVAILSPEEAEVDPDAGGQESSLLRQAVGIVIGVSNPSDPFGETPIVGSNRQAASQSDGRGLLEVQEELFAAIRQLSQVAQINIVYRAAGAARAERHAEHGYIATRAYRFEAFCTTFRTYHEPNLFSATVSGSDVNLSWSAPDDSTYLVSYVLRRASGAIPPSLPTDGTSIPIVPPLATSKVDTPGAGMWSYSLFAGYDELGGASPVSHSIPRTLRVTV
jgi:hypothetical protein